MQPSGFIRGASALAGVSFAFVAFTVAAEAKTIAVGPTQYYKTIQAGIGAAASGDVISIDPGTYACAVVNKSGLTLQGKSAGVVVTGTVCQSKGLFVVSASNTTVNNITFKGAKATDGNGAGIRMQGTNLTVLNASFTSNQNGILADANTKSVLTVTDSVFTHNGTCSSASGCAHAIYAGHILKLDVENSTFTDTQAGHAIKSRANNTIVMGSKIQDTTTGTSSYLIDVPNGGSVLITGNYLEKGPKSSNSTAAIALGEEGSPNPLGSMVIANNTFQNDFTKTQNFVWNATSNAGLLVAGNVLNGIATNTLKGVGTVSTAPWDPGSGNPPPIDVPESFSLALFAGSLLGLVLLLRRRKIAA